MIRALMLVALAVGALTACGGGQQSCSSVQSALDARLTQYGKDANFTPVSNYVAGHGDDLKRCNLSP